jgi:hypothetical protein
MWAVTENKLENVRALIEAGADLNLPMKVNSNN